jgi:alkanesulfonate monooxygenase SsuD/methylene tetrahydromethanopterin reductase-like flavin-dependent oxidoreductase (luciferase family)
MPFNYNHPVRVAERAAMLDTLSGGRLDLGAGRGATLQEMTLCNVDPERTYLEVEESLRMISSMWLNDEFSWDGELTIAPHPIIPRPAQLPHPPLFMACSKKDTVTLAAEYGVGALVLGFAFAGLAAWFAAQRTTSSARLLFLGSITYLPLLWILMAVTKT